MWENMDIDCELLFECTSLMTNAFTLNSASPTSRRIEQRARATQRRQNIAPLRMNYDAATAEKCETPEKQVMHSSEDLSLYEGSSPQQSPPPCPIDACMESDLSPETSPARYMANTPVRTRTIARRIQITQSQITQTNVIQNEDPNSVDSGYSYSQDAPTPSTSAAATVFKFPSGIVVPRKTPAKSPKMLCHTLSGCSVESVDEEFDMDLCVMEDDDDDQQIPTDFSSLLRGDIKAVRNSPPSDVRSKPAARRSLSLSEPEQRLNQRSKSLFDDIERRPMHEINNANDITPARNTFKRPEPPTISPTQSKRLKFENIQENVAPVARPLFKKSISLNNDSTHSIMTALHRSNTEPNLIGDFSRPFCLPLIHGKHSDLKSISVDTMAGLIRGEFNEHVESFKVIDCRYPYEFDGGHIRGAINLYMQEQILEEFVNSKTEVATTENGGTTKRNILVFHCEFSSERGPKLSRFLRNTDRVRNTDTYPALHYPEVYLLHGGYKDFFAAHANLCDPITYRPMLDPTFSEEFKQFRAKTRSWSGGDPKATATKGGLSRSRSRLVL